MTDPNALSNWNHISALSWTGNLLVVFACTWLAYQIVSYPFFFLWNRGYDQDKNLKPVQRLLGLVFGLLGIVYFLDSIRQYSPAAASYLALILFLFGLYTQKDLLQNMIAGFVLLLQNKIKAGSWITHEKISGKIVGIKMLQTQIRADNGDFVLVPNYQVLTGVTVLRSQSTGFKIVIKLTLESDSLSLEEIKRLAITSPYRKANSDITVDQDNFKFPKNISVMFYVWSPAILHLAKAQFFSALQPESKTSSRQ